MRRDALLCLMPVPQLLPCFFLRLSQPVVSVTHSSSFVVDLHFSACFCISFRILQSMHNPHLPIWGRVLFGVHRGNGRPIEYIAIKPAIIPCHNATSSQNVVDPCDASKKGSRKPELPPNSPPGPTGQRDGTGRATGMLSRALNSESPPLSSHLLLLSRIHHFPMFSPSPRPALSRSPLF